MFITFEELIQFSICEITLVTLILAFVNFILDHKDKK